MSGSISTALSLDSPPCASSAPALLIVVLENAGLEQALASHPAFRDLARAGCLMTDYRGITAPSQCNYWAMTGGSTFGRRTNESVDLPDTSVFDLLDRAGVDWKVYLEDYPDGERCFTGPRRAGYVRKHNPAGSYLRVLTDPRRCARQVPASQLKRDIAAGALPRFAFYVPDQRNNGHDTGPAYTGEYLRHHWFPLLADPALMRDRTVVFTYDENETGERVPVPASLLAPERQRAPIFTVLVGPAVQPGSTVGTTHDHYSLLRTVEESFNLGHLGRRDALARRINAPAPSSGASPGAYLRMCSRILRRP